jgi:PAS domain-containing protein
MNFSRKILMLFFMGGFILSGCVLSCLLLNVQFLIIIFFIPLFMTGAGFLVSRLLGTPLSNFVSEMEMKHQEYFESIIDLDGCDEITRLDKLNNQLLQALNKTREELAAASDDFEKLKIDADSLTERETYFHRLFEHSNDAVFIYDFEGKLLDVNKRACKMLGYSKKELIKIPFLICRLRRRS